MIDPNATFIDSNYTAHAHLIGGAHIAGVAAGVRLQNTWRRSATVGTLLRAQVSHRHHGILGKVEKFPRSDPAEAPVLRRLLIRRLQEHATASTSIM